MYTKGDMKITVDACKCDKCGHVWLPEKGEPERCAKCKRFGWNGGEPKGEKTVRTTGKNQKLKKMIEATQARKSAKRRVKLKEKAGARHPNVSVEAIAGAGHSTEVRASESSGNPIAGSNPADASAPALSRECKLGAHAGCKGCACDCHKK